MSFTLAVTGYYVDTMDPAKPTILGNVPGGNDTVLERLLDWSTYFTILSNIVVAGRDHHARRPARACSRARIAPEPSGAPCAWTAC